ncbi:basic proline-rich protein-like [Vulpes lagopus]|uniref:basic proline-rich protein-like n=1 Tax=Vulpes lagopus TaxID=494514 RepID=UPI001BC987AF|nr:basic proline-rich protein-like [Vulpes lagopus]
MTPRGGRWEGAGEPERAAGPREPSEKNTGCINQNRREIRLTSSAKKCVSSNFRRPYQSPSAVRGASPLPPPPPPLSPHGPKAPSGPPSPQPPERRAAPRPCPCEAPSSSWSEAPVNNAGCPRGLGFPRGGPEASARAPGRPDLGADWGSRAPTEPGAPPSDRRRGSSSARTPRQGPLALWPQDLPSLPQALCRARPPQETQRACPPGPPWDLTRVPQAVRFPGRQVLPAPPRRRGRTEPEEGARPRARGGHTPAGTGERACGARGALGAG